MKYGKQHSPPPPASTSKPTIEPLPKSISNKPAHPAGTSAPPTTPLSSSSFPPEPPPLTPQSHSPTSPTFPEIDLSATLDILAARFPDANARPVLDLTPEDTAILIAYYRRQRARIAAGEKPTKPKLEAARPKVDLASLLRLPSNAIPAAHGGAPTAGYTAPSEGRKR